MSTDTKLLAAQARIKVLREALADLHYTVYRDDATGDSAGDALRETDDTAELDALVKDAEWNKAIRNSVDRLLAEAGYSPDSSSRHQLSMMRFDAMKEATP